MPCNTVCGTWELSTKAIRVPSARQIAETWHSELQGNWRTGARKEQFSSVDVSQGNVRSGTDMIFVMLGVASGVSFAFLRYPFLPLLPIGALLAAGALLTGIFFGSHPGLIAAEIFGSIAAPQFAFAAVSLTDHLVRSSRLIPQVQAAIGRQLRAELEAPLSLPPELAALVTQLRRRYSDSGLRNRERSGGNAAPSRWLGALPGTNQGHD